MDEEIETYLKQHTNLDWEEISPLYLYYKTHYNPHRQFCVFAPPDWITKGPFAKFYIPKNGQDLHDPERFLQYLNNKKGQLVKNMPWIQIDLDNLPSFTAEMIISTNIIVVYTIKFKGTAKIRKLEGLNDGDLSFGNHGISYSAKQKLGEFLDQFKAKIDIKTRKFSFGESIMGPDNTITLELDGPDTLKGELSPSFHPYKIIFADCEIELQLGYSVTVHFAPNGKLEHNLAIEAAIIGTCGLIIFAGGLIGAGVAVGGAIA